MNRRLNYYVYGCLLIAGAMSLLAGAWVYRYEQPSGDAWVVEQAEQVVSGVSAGEEIHVTFVLRNTSPMPRRILGVEAC